MRQRIPEELPVLTDLVLEEIDKPSPSNATDDVIPTHARPAWASQPVKPPAAASAPALAPSEPPVAPAVRTSAIANPADVLDVFPRMSYDAPSVTALASVRDQFNAQLLTKLEELQHGVYSQVMQQLEIYASGTLKAHLRETLLPALTDIARDIAEQVAEDTAAQVRTLVSKAVDSEISRLREQLSKRRF